MMTWTTRRGLLILVTLLVSAGCATAPPQEIAEEPSIQAVDLGPQTRVYESRFPSRSTLQELLEEFGVGAARVHQLIEDTRDVYDLNRVRAGNPFRIETSLDGELLGFDYEIDSDEFFQVDLKDGQYVGQRSAYQFEVEEAEISGVVENSLWAALKAQGEGDELVLEMVDVLRWDLDFTSLQSGDWFRVIVEKKWRPGRVAKYGQIKAVQYNSSGSDTFGFVFHAPGADYPSFYDEKGKALRKAFLKVPFNFSPRISSGFSYSRFHPILKKRRPHLAVDFAAPHGTPVIASANGKVIFAGRKGGYGNLVQIKHPNGYTTGYAHLSRILVRSGQNVRQSQVIGRVGSTGLATAAHLDYRIIDPRGRFVNPRKKISWPSDTPVEERHWSEFVALRDAYMQRLDSIAVPLRPSKSQSVAD